MHATSVLIVAHQSVRDLPLALASLARAGCGGAGPRVTVVDNGSTDGTAELVRNRFPWVELVEAGSNLGFAAGANLGLRAALARDDGFVYLLNPDTEVDPGFLRAALATAEESAGIAAVQSLLLLDPERHLIDSAGGRVHFLGFGYCAGHRRATREFGPRDRDIAFASGAGCLLRLSAVAEIGFFDEGFFLYGEDLDLGWRLRLAGHRCRLAAASRVHHRHVFRRHADKHFHLERGRTRALIKNASGRLLGLLAPLLLAAELALLVVAIRQGWAAQKVRAWRGFLRRTEWRELRRARRSVQATRRIPDREIARSLEGRLVQPGVVGARTGSWLNPPLDLAWSGLRAWL